MADGYAWASGGLGIAILSRGPGLTNGLTGLANAVKGGRSVVVVSCERSTDGGLGFDLAKLLAQDTMAASVGLAYLAPREPAAVVPALRDACARAAAGEPALVAVPANVLRARGVTRPAPRPPTVRGAAEPPPPADADLEALVEVLAAAERPLLLAGRGAMRGDTPALLRALAERIGALLGTSLLAKSLFRGHPLDVGVVGGFAHESARRLIVTADCILALGASLNLFTRAHGTLFKSARILQVDADARQLGRFGRIDLGVVADARATAELLLDRLEPVRDAHFNRPELRAAIGERTIFAPGDESTAEHVDPRTLVVALNELLPPDRVVVTDGGHQVGFSATALDVAGPGDLRLTPYDFGTLGMGLGVAIGAGVARPERTTALLIGDGGLLMTLGDLQSAARLGSPLVVVVMNDRAYGAERHFLALEGAPYGHALFPDTDFAGIAAALGIESATIRSTADLRAVAARLERRSSPLLLDCKLTAEVRAPWMAALEGYRRRTIVPSSTSTR
jgi:thiamine pyrophosphate-dependent acetolactate synthase large subunit-like protein